MNCTSNSRFGTGLIVSGMCSLILIFIVCVFVIGASSRSEGTDPLWPGFHVLLVGSDVPAGDVETMLASAGIEKVLSEADMTVQFCEYPGIGEIPLAQISHRFDDADPRLDGYMRRIGNYFRSKDGKFSLYYCEDVMPKADFSSRVQTAFAGRAFRWLIPDAGAVPGYLVPLVLAAAGAVTAVFLKRGRIRILLLTLAVSGTGFFFDPVSLPAAVLLMFGLTYSGTDILEWLRKRLDESGQRNAGTPAVQFPRLKLLLPGVTITAAAVIVLSAESGYMRAAAATAASVLTAAAAAFFAAAAGIILVRHARREHQLFSPVPLRTRRKQHRGIPILAALSCAAVCTAGCLLISVLYTGTSEGIPRIPLPNESGAAAGGGGFENSESIPEGYLPDVNDYLEHRAYQELYQYGGNRDLSTYFVSEEKIIKRLTDAAVIDDEWKAQMVREFSRSPVGRLLTTGSGSGTAEYRPPVGISEVPPAPAALIISWLAVIIAGILGTTPLTAAKLYGMKAIEPRRRRQAA